jgi:rfaE bifunctional protein kinase chain/domain
VNKFDISEIKKKYINERISLVSGNFNIVHPGHLRLLRFAKECGDCLVVAVNCDGMDPGAVINEEERLAGVRANVWVDHAFILRESVADFIKKLQPEFVVKGKEHQNRFNIEQDAINSYGGTLLFTSGEVAFSSIELLHLDNSNHLNAASPELQEYMHRHKIDPSDLIKKIREASKLKIAVIGETILDDYISCEALGLSKEAPCMVVSPLEKQRYIGGAAIVAAHIAVLGAQVDFLTLTGNDQASEFLEQELPQKGVKLHCFKDISRPTIVKERYRIDNNSVFRVSHLRQHEISLDIQNQIFTSIEKLIKKLDMVVFSDFNYGMLPDSLVQKITKLAKNNDVRIIADSQTSSQQGDISRYYDTELLTPTEHEARVALRDNQSGIVVLCEKLRSKTNGNNIFLKLGSEGILIHAFNKESGHWETDRIPAINLAPIDVAGAGDSVLACASIMLARGGSVWEAAIIGSIGAACQVSRIGNIPLTIANLEKQMQVF